MLIYNCVIDITNPCAHVMYFVLVCILFMD